jgi:hypothetical protein
VRKLAHKELSGIARAPHHAGSARAAMKGISKRVSIDMGPPQLEGCLCRGAARGWQVGDKALPELKNSAAL